MLFYHGVAARAPDVRALGVTMSELDHHDLTQDRGLQISAESQYLDVYRLLTVFGGSEKVAAHVSANPSSTLHDLSSRFERSEAARLLLNVAVVSRSVLDWGWVEPIDGNRIRAGGDVVGWLEGTPGAPRGNLRFRDACNKIIHALGITFSAGEPRGTLPYLAKEVRVTGEKGAKRWIASIDVFIFAECAYNVL